MFDSSKSPASAAWMISQRDDASNRSGCGVGANDLHLTKTPTRQLNEDSEDSDGSNHAGSERPEYGSIGPSPGCNRVLRRIDIDSADRNPAESTPANPSLFWKHGSGWILQNLAMNPARGFSPKTRPRNSCLIRKHGFENRVSKLAMDHHPRFPPESRWPESIAILETIDLNPCFSISDRSQGAVFGRYSGGRIHTYPRNNTQTVIPGRKTPVQQGGADV